MNKGCDDPWAKSDKDTFCSEDFHHLHCFDNLFKFIGIENGDTVNVTLSNLFKIAKAFKLDLNQLLDIKG